MAKSHSGQGGAKNQPRQQAGARDQGARRRDKAKEHAETIRQLQTICSPGDPNAIFRSLVKIGQGCVAPWLGRDSH